MSLRRAHMSLRRVILVPACLAVAALIAVGVAELPRGGPTSGTVSARLTPAQTSVLLASSPPVLAALHAQGGALLGGGALALRAGLTAPKGHPVVINKGASWGV